MVYLCVFSRFSVFLHDFRGARVEVVVGGGWVPSGRAELCDRLLICFITSFYVFASVWMILCSHVKAGKHGFNRPETSRPEVESSLILACIP